MPRTSAQPMKISFWKKRLVDFYRDHRITGIQCMVTGVKEHKYVRAAHIWKHCTSGRGLPKFGLREEDVTSERNGLLLVTGIERAFDYKRICFLYNGLEKKFYLYVADPSLKDQRLALEVDRDDVVLVEHPELTYGDLHMTYHLYMPENHKPFRRLLYFHAKCTFDEAADKHWPIDKRQWKLYRDLSPGWTDTEDASDEEDDGAASGPEGEGKTD